ncbi:prolipoprotein diacylglyceryl transferase [Patescibacteria group bacterium]|nr:prolipoprotein diacylglyceryl transferase [Patescibacteria group bacterium]
MNNLFSPSIYGLIIALAILIGLWVCFLETKRKKQDVKVLFDVAFWVLISGLVGARFYHVVHQWSFYQENPGFIFHLWNGGLGIYGAIFGGLLAIWIYTRFKKLDFLIWSDIAVLGLPLGQAIGRWANFFNQELYGYPTNLAWAIYIEPINRLPQFKNISYFHPLFLYESFWNLAVFLIIFFAGRRLDKRLLKGELFILYISLYSLGRFFIEFLKPDVWRLAALPAAQLIAVFIIVLCLIITAVRRCWFKQVNVKI